MSYNIKFYRDKANKTQEQLANEVGITSVYLSYIENGHKEPSMPLLRKIANALHVSVKKLISEETGTKVTA
jgi:transcriptional regulator with XRE-family HTH domain